MNLLIDSLLTIHIIVSLLLVGVVLLQRPRSEGLGTAFASGMVEQYIGPATSVLVRFTTWMAGAFFFLTVVLAVLYSHQNNGKSLIAAKLSAAAAKATPTPAAPATSLPVVLPVVPSPTPVGSATPTASVAPALPPATSIATPEPSTTVAPAPANVMPAATPVVVTTAPVTVPSTAATDAAAPTPTVNPVATPNDIPAPAH